MVGLEPTTAGLKIEVWRSDESSPVTSVALPIELHPWFCPA